MVYGRHSCPPFLRRKPPASSHPVDGKTAKRNEKQTHRHIYRETRRGIVHIKNRANKHSKKSRQTTTIVSYRKTRLGFICFCCIPRSARLLDSALGQPVKSLPAPLSGVGDPFREASFRQDDLCVDPDRFDPDRSFDRSECSLDRSLDRSFVQRTTQSFFCRWRRKGKSVVSEVGVGVGWEWRCNLVYCDES